MTTPSFLQVLWFALIGILWAGYFILEGFDFGVGMLVRALGRDTTEKRMIIHTIGPVWDGNEVWLIVAGGATWEWAMGISSGVAALLFGVAWTNFIHGVPMTGHPTAPTSCTRACSTCCTRTRCSAGSSR